MTPAGAIAALDRQLARHGQDVTLRRVVPNAPALEVTVRAFVRGYTPDEFAGNIQQGDSEVILSPSGMSAPFVGEPLRVNDRLVIAGRARNVQSASAVWLGGAIVRINVQVRG